MNRPHRRNPIRITWSIKGYHAYRIKPTGDIKLTVVPDPHNRFDPHAMAVRVPQVEQIPQHLRNRLWDSRAGQQPVQELAGAMVGHVPANLCTVFHRLQEMGMVRGHITARAVGRARQTQNPPPWARFQRGVRRDNAGGGAEIPCVYKITVARVHLRQAMRVFEEHLTHGERQRLAV